MPRSGSPGTCLKESSFPACPSETIGVCAVPVPSLFASGLNADSSSHCPLCGSDQFDLQTRGGDQRFVCQTCLVCGLSCCVVLGPESLPAEARVSEWAAVFAHD